MDLTAAAQSLHAPVEVRDRSMKEGLEVLHLEIACDPAPGDSESRNVGGLLHAVIDRIECGLLACGSEGRLIHANLAAQRELQEASVLRLAGAHVVCVGPGHAAWSSAVAAASGRNVSSLVELGGADRPLTVAVLPLRLGPDQGLAALTVMGRRAACSPLALEMLSSHHGLTYAEGRVLRALVENCSAREIAAQHGVGLATVRTQIQAVRDKLGVRSIDALLLRAAQVPPVTALL